MKTDCVCYVGGMVNVLQLIERQRERRSNRSVAVSHDSGGGGSDMHSGATFTVESLNSTHPVTSGCHRPTSTELQHLRQNGRSRVSFFHLFSLSYMLSGMFCRPLLVAALYLFT